MAKVHYTNQEEELAEKEAKELVYKFYKCIPVNDRNPKLEWESAKQNALICQNERIDELEATSIAVGVHNIYLIARLIYLTKVKQKIKEL